LYPPAPPVLYCLDSPRLFLIIMCIFIANRIYRIRCLIALDLRILACLLQLCQYLSVSLLKHPSSPIKQEAGFLIGHCPRLVLPSICHTSSYLARVVGLISLSDLMGLGIDSALFRGGRQWSLGSRSP
jgi:hypothetical protein